jgi:hypothetical protein
VYVVGTPGP